MNKDDTHGLIVRECERIKALLLEKNRHYGDSAIHPLRVFSRADTLEQLRVRIDDKLSRMRQGNPDDPEKQDIIDDLIGYLILLNVAQGVKSVKGHAYHGPMTIEELAASRGRA